MGASSSKESLSDAVGALRCTEVSPSNGDGDVYSALFAAPGSWDELVDAFPAAVVREVRDAHPRNLAYLLAACTGALELALDADGPAATAEARAAQAAGCLRLLARVVPFVAGDARLGAGGAGDEAAEGDAERANAALAELDAFLAGGPLPAPRADSWAAAAAAEEAEAAAAEQRLSAGGAEALIEAGSDVGEYAAPPLDDAQSGAVAETTAVEAAEPAPQAPATPPAADAAAGTSAASLGAPPLWQRIACAVAAAALCPEVTLPRRASAWAPPLAPASASLPPDAEFTAARVDALRCLSCLAAAEALYVPFGAPHAADAPLAAPPPAASFLAAFAGRGAGADALPPGVTRRLFASLLNGASCAPGLAGDSPEGAALVAGCMRALLLLVSVAEEDVPMQPPSAHRREPSAEDAPALFAAMALPQAALLHASLAAALATAASAAVATAEWADVLSGVVPAAAAASGEATQLQRTPPPGAAEAVALALFAAERAPAFSDVAAGRAGAGGWLLASPVLVLMLVLRDEPSAAGLLRAGSFLLLNLGSVRAFGVALNEPLRSSDAALASACGLGPPFPPGATRADALLAALACLLAYPLARGASLGRERPLYAPLLAVLLNAAPLLKGVTPPGAGAMMHLLAALAQPSVLLRDEAGAPLLRSCLDTLAATLCTQADANPALCGALLRHSALIRDLQELRLPEPEPQPAVAAQEGPPSAEAETTLQESAAADAPAASGALFGGLRVVGPETASPAFAPDNAWLDGVRQHWPLAELRAVASALEAAWLPWLEAHPGASVYAEADFLRTLPLAGALPPPRPLLQRTYARTAGVASWQARHAAGLALLAEPAAVDGRRVRRLRVALR